MLPHVECPYCKERYDCLVYLPIHAEVIDVPRFVRKMLNKGCSMEEIKTFYVCVALKTNGMNRAVTKKQLGITGHVLDKYLENGHG